MKNGLKPLEKLGQHDGFIILFSIFPLYEKYLRVKYSYTGRFTKGARIFKEVGKNFAISADDAFILWSCYRNGLSHRAIPDSETAAWQLTDTGNAVEIKNAIVTINPLRFRDEVLEKVKNDPGMWKRDSTPLPNEFIER